MEPDLSERITESLPWLDDAADSMRQAFEPVLGQDAPRGLRDALYGTWLGHPLHPAVVTVPVGCWTATAVFDLIGEQRAADLTLNLGLAGALLSAASGAAQWQDYSSQKEIRRIGALHAILNSAATVLFAGSALARRGGNRAPGVALSTLGLGINLASAWLGGELSYKLGAGVDRTAFQTAPEEWTDVLAEADLHDATPVRVTVGDTPVMLVRDGGEIRAIGAVCSHMGGPLDEGEIADGCVTCPWHGSVFKLDDGSAVHGPATSPQPNFEVRAQGGRLAVRPAPPKPLGAADLAAVAESATRVLPTGQADGAAAAG
jgi:nitrite reductase/ring-hydroxylating ferredoxin subunit/uncharacterized membrane protein